MNALGFLGIATIVTTLWFTLIVLIPTAARARFEFRVDGMRNELVDSVLRDGVLNDCDATAFYINVCSTLSDNAKHLTLGRALALQIAYEASDTAPAQPPTFGALPAEQRRALHDFEQRLFREVSWYFIWGSRLGLALSAARFVGRMLRLELRSKTLRRAAPRKLARTAVAEPDLAVGETIYPGNHPQFA